MRIKQLQIERLTPQPFTLEGLKDWAQEAGHYMLPQLVENFHKFTLENPWTPPQKIDNSD